MVVHEPLPEEVEEVGRLRREVLQAFQAGDLGTLPATSVVEAPLLPPGVVRLARVDSGTISASFTLEEVFPREDGLHDAHGTLRVELPTINSVINTRMRYAPHKVLCKSDCLCPPCDHSRGSFEWRNRDQAEAFPMGCPLALIKLNLLAERAGHLTLAYAKDALNTGRPPYGGIDLTPESTQVLPESWVEGE
jgi:hypothetical protein